jgi:signal transduction histidine kinase
MVDLLTEDPTLSTEQRECINSIQVSAKALLTIVNDTLDFSKIESGRFDIEEEPFNLGSTVSSLCQLLTTFSHQKGVNFICQYSLDENLEILGDAGRIRQILSNLLMNALKFTAQGSVKISVASKTIESEIKDYETLEVQFVIEDTGIGIKKHVLDTLFTPYYQGDASTARLHGGTGLGLTISQNVSSCTIIPFFSLFYCGHFRGIN